MHTREDPLIGRLYAGRYRIESLIATGGMGKVYRARQQSPNRLIALKVVRGDLAAGANAGERFKRELSATALIEHPHTVRVYDFGQAADGELFYAMELLHGETLRQLVGREGALAPDRAVRVARQMAKALGAAHDKGIVHRDIKPDNVMLTSPYGEQDFVKVLDFGLARFAEGAPDERHALTATGLLLGTPDYMAPEQAEERAIDGRTDLYALGCVLYQILTGAPPFTATTPLRVLYKHLHEPPRPPSELNPLVPPALDALILRLLAKSPDERPATAHETIVALDEVTRSMGVAPPADTAPFERPRPRVDAPTHLMPTPPGFGVDEVPADSHPTEVVPTPVPLSAAPVAPRPAPIASRPAPVAPVAAPAAPLPTPPSRTPAAPRGSVPASLETDAPLTQERPRRKAMLAAAIVVPLVALGIGIFAGSQRDDANRPPEAPRTPVASTPIAPTKQAAAQASPASSQDEAPEAAMAAEAKMPEIERSETKGGAPAPAVLVVADDRQIERRTAEDPRAQPRRDNLESTPPRAAVSQRAPSRPRPAPRPPAPRAVEPW